LDGGEIRVCGVSDLDAKPITDLDVVVQVDAVGSARGRWPGTGLPRAGPSCTF